MYRYLLLGLAAITLFISCNSNDKEQIFTKEELAIINDTLSPLMKVFVITDKSDSLLLRRTTAELSNAELQSKAYETLCRRMVKTVTDSTVDGVGIAGPQVGISRRVVAVQRYDKEGAPFEVYPNIYIKEYSKETVPGREGCLSVPKSTLSEQQMKCGVLRSEWIIISYTDVKEMKTVQDTVKGYTARIFQHETDHLEGILYTDRIQPTTQP